MNPETVFRVYTSHPTGFARKVYESMLLTCNKILETEMYSIANALGEEGKQFIEFCRSNDLLRERTMSDAWERNYTHSCARRYPKQDEFDVQRAREDVYKELYRREESQ